MEKFGLIGWPIGHSRSPELFRAAYHERFQYELIEEEAWDMAWKRFVEGPYRAVNVTAPFKMAAAEAADLRDSAVEAIGAANILVKTEEGIKAFNSDYLGVRMLLQKYASGMESVKVIGGGGAGKAALEAAESLGFDTSLIRHNNLKDGAEADVIVFTLPQKVEGCEKLDSRVLIEANYRDPSFGPQGIAPGKGCLYVPGMEWLVAQAVCGYALMTGEAPDEENINKCAILREF